MMMMVVMMTVFATITIDMMLMDEQVTMSSILRAISAIGGAGVKPHYPRICQ